MRIDTHSISNLRRLKAQPCTTSTPWNVPRNPSVGVGQHPQLRAGSVDRLADSHRHHDLAKHHLFFAVSPVVVALCLTVLAAWTGFGSAPKLGTVAGVCAGIATVSFPAFQVRHLVRTGSTAGVSPVAWLLLFWVAAAWSTHGVVYNDPYQLSVNAICLPLTGLVLYRIHREHAFSARSVVGCIGIVALSMAATVVGGVLVSAASVVLLSTLIGVYMVSRLATATLASGFSRRATMASSVAQILWLTHALAMNNAVVAVHAFVVIAWNSAAVLAASRRTPAL